MPLRRYPQRRLQLGVLVGLFALLQISLPGSARAGQIDDKQAEAARVAAEIDSQTARITELARLQRRAQAQADQAREAVAQAEEEMRLAEREVQFTRERLARYAVESYVHGGSTFVLTNLFRSNADELIFRRTYLQVAMGEDRAVLEDLRARQEDLAARRARLRAASQEAEAANRELAGDLEALQAAEAAQQAKLGRIKGELVQLVAAEQARRDAEAARAALAAPRRPAAAAPKGGPAGAPGGIWECIRQLESGGNYASPGGGAYQFLDSTWQSLGQSGTASDAPPELQDAMAIQLQQRSGWDQWTTASRCGR